MLEEQEKQIENKTQSSVEGQVFTWKDLRETREPRISQCNRRIFELRRNLGEKIIPTRKKIKLFLRDHYHLIFKCAADNHMRIQSAIKKADGTVEVLMVFQSYTALKNYQKKVRRVTLSASAMVSLMVISTLVVQLILPVFKSKASTYDWMQNSWQTADANTVVDGSGNNLTNGWSKYASKDASIDTSNGVSFATENASWVQDTDSDFNAGTLKQEVISSNSFAANLILASFNSLYLTSGDYISPIHDTVGNSGFGNISWVETLNGGSTKMRVRTSNDQSMNGAHDWDDSCNISKNTDISNVTACVHDGDRYIQYQIIINSSEDQSNSPSIDKVVINYARIAPQINFKTQDTQQDFETTGFSNSNSSTSQNSGAVELEKITQNYSLTQTDNSNTATSPGVQGGWASPSGIFSSTVGQNSQTGAAASIALLGPSVNGGTGSEGAIEITNSCTGSGISGTYPNCTITSGTHNYTNFTIGSGAILSPSGGVATIKATGAVTINGLLNFQSKGAFGGSGAQAGYSSGFGGGSSSESCSSSGSGGTGITSTPGGAPGAGGSAGTNASSGGGGGGGCGGGGGGANTSNYPSGGNGGQAGGILSFTSANSIVISDTGSINANGANGQAWLNGYGGGGGGGGGGKITLIAPNVANQGIITAKGGGGGAGGSFTLSKVGGNGGGGLVTISTQSFLAGSNNPIVIAGSGGNGGTVGNYSLQALPYYATGTYTSFLDGGPNAISYNWNSFTPSVTTPSNSSITFALATSSTAIQPSFTGCGSTIIGNSCIHTTDRYFWYKATLNASTDLYYSPTLDQVLVDVGRVVYNTSGIYTSAVLNAGDNSAWQTIDWTEDASVLPSTDVKIRVRSCDDASCSSAGRIEPALNTCPTFSRADKNVVDMVSASKGCVRNRDQYIQYEVDLSSTDSTKTPSLQKVDIKYLTWGNSSGVLTSSVFDSFGQDNALAKIGLQGKLPSGTTVRAQLRAGIDNNPGNGNWTKWCGSNSCDDDDNYDFSSDKVFDFSKETLEGNMTLQALNNISNPLTNFNHDNKYQYFQYRLVLNSSNPGSPKVSQAQIEYARNGSPKVTNVGASQDSDGNINIAFDDADTDSPDRHTISVFADFGITLAADLTVNAANTNISLAESGTTNINKLPISAINIQIENEQFVCATRSGNVLNNCARAQNNSQLQAHSGAKTIWFKGATFVNSPSIGSGVIPAADLTAEWNVKVDYNGIFYNSARILLNANDGNGMNQIGNASSGIFALDTLDPAISSVVLDAPTQPAKTNSNTHPVQVTYTETNQTSCKIRYSNDGNSWSDWDACSATGTGKAQTKNNWDITSGFGANSSDGFKQVFAQIMDSNGNLSSATSSAIINYDTTSPINKIINAKAQDASNDLISTGTESRIFLSWEVIPISGTALNGASGDFGRYHVWRGATNADINDENAIPESGENSWAEISDTNYADRTNRQINYFVDTNIDKNHRYYYRVKAQDDIENISPDYSDSVTTVPNGSGGVGLSVPNISNANVVDKGTTWIELGWSTPELSDSKVYYSTGSVDESSANVFVPTMVKNDNHRVVVTGLNPNTDYKFLLKSANALGNTDSKNLSDSTNVGPKISNVVVSEVYNKKAVIQWETSDTADSNQVYYAEANNSGLPNFADALSQDAICSQGAPIVCEATIENLKAGYHKYYFYVKSDNASDKNPLSGEFVYYNFVTTNDLTPPTITFSGAPTLLTSDKAVLQWTSDEAAKISVLYGEKGGSEIAKTVDFGKDGAVVLDKLDPATDYEFYLTAEDVNGNNVIKKAGSNNDRMFTFRTSAVITGGPLNDPGELKVLQVSENDAVLVFDNVTSAFATSKLCYDTTQVSDDAINGTNGQSCLNYEHQSVPTKTHFYHLTELSPGTRYYLKVKIANADDDTNVFYKTSEIVTSTLETRIALAKPTGKVVAAQYSDAEAMIILDQATNTNALSKICYDTNPITDDAINELNGQICRNKQEINIATRTHAYHLTGLAPNQKYYIKMKVTDEINTDLNFILDEAQFTTLELQEGHPDLVRPSGDPAIKQISDTEAMVLLPETVNTLSTSKLCISKNAITDVDVCVGGQVQTVDIPTRTHAYHVSGLEPKAIYHFRMNITDSLKPEIIFTLNDISAETLAKQVAHPELVASVTPQVLQKSDKEAVLLLTANTDAWSKLWYAKNDTISDGEIANCENNKAVCKYSMLEITDKTRNHVYRLTNLDFNSTYHFRIKTIDSENTNKTFISDDVVFETKEKQIDHPLAESGTSNVLFAGQAQAIIAWQTAGKNIDGQMVPTLSVAKLCYSEKNIADEEMDNCINSVESNEKVTTHIFTLSDLKSNTPYHYRIKTVDSEDDTSHFLSDDATLQTVMALDTQAPELANQNPVTILDTQAQSATIQIVTKEDSIAFVQYLDTKDNFVANSMERSDSKQYTKSHIITVSNLKQDSDRYYFKVKLQDAKGNTVTYPINVDEYYDFPTVKGPGIQNDSIICKQDKTGLNIFWKTGANGDSYVEYSTNKNLEGFYKNGKDEQKTDHNVLLNNLFPYTPYYYQAISTDSRGATSSSDIKSCSTLDGVVDAEAPNVLDVQAILIGKNQAVINWYTNELATTQVEYGKDNNYGQLSTVNTDLTVEHRQQLNSLQAGTTYHYRVVSHDGSGNEQKSSDYTFKTLTDDLSDNTLSGFLDKLSPSPTISSPSANISQLEGTTVTITWKTDKESNSLVSYKPEGSDNYSEQGNSTDVIKEHTVILNNLSPNTKYSYFVKSVDSLGGSGQSEVATFTTAPASDIFNVKVVDINYDSATVSWETSTNCTAQMDYGKNGKYGQTTKEDQNYAKAHVINLRELDPGVTYNFRLKDKDKEGNIYSSSEYTFQTPSPPEISDFKLDSITENKIKVYFKTNVETEAFVTLTNLSDEKDVHAQGDPKLAIEHSIEVANLNSGVQYSLKIKVSDAKGSAIEKNIDNYTTAKDENAPKIDQIKSDSALTQNDKVQTIISWVTDEPANSYVVYSEGRNGNKTTVKVDDNYSIRHTYISTNFKPGTTYNFNVRSTDKSGNVATSNDYALLTPKQKENIVQIILGNFLDIFGWVKMGN